MIKITLKGLSGTICERTFKTVNEAYAWLDNIMRTDGNCAIGYTIEGDEE